MGLPKILDQFFEQDGEYDLFMQNSSFDINAYLLSNFDPQNDYSRFLAKMKILDQNYNFESLHFSGAHDMLLDEDETSTSQKIGQIQEKQKGSAYLSKPELLEFHTWLSQVYGR